jgi:hypothetical protein
MRRLIRRLWRWWHYPRPNHGGVSRAWLSEHDYEKDGY